MTKLTKPIRLSSIVSFVSSGPRNYETNPKIRWLGSCKGRALPPQEHQSGGSKLLTRSAHSRRLTLGYAAQRSFRGANIRAPLSLSEG